MEYPDPDCVTHLRPLALALHPTPSTWYGRKEGLLDQGNPSSEAPPPPIGPNEPGLVLVRPTLSCLLLGLDAKTAHTGDPRSAEPPRHRDGDDASREGEALGARSSLPLIAIHCLWDGKWRDPDLVSVTFANRQCFKPRCESSNSPPIDPLNPIPHPPPCRLSLSPPLSPGKRIGGRGGKESPRVPAKQDLLLADLALHRPRSSSIL